MFILFAMKATKVNKQMSRKEDTGFIQASLSKIQGLSRASKDYPTGIKEKKLMKILI